MLRIGILLPRSTLFPLIGFDILDGIKACLQQKGLGDDFKLLIENISFGINENEVYTKVEKLLLEENCDVIVAVADIRMDEMLAPLFTATNKLLIVANFGANMPDKWQATPCVITHSLNFCFHTWLTGKLAAAEQTADTACLTSYYDAGYRQCFSMINSYQHNNKPPAFTQVTHFKKDEFTLAPLEELFQQHPQVKSLLCLFAGDLAVKFYEDIQPFQQQQGLVLYLSPCLLDESLKEMSPQPLTLKDAKGYMPWFAGLTNANNLVFTNAIHKIKGKPSNYFNLLGWETGLMLAGILPAENVNGNELIARLISLEFDSPRGWLKIDSATNHSYGPSYLVDCSGNMELHSGAEYANLEEAWKAFTAEDYPASQSSGWRNTYLCL